MNAFLVVVRRNFDDTPILLTGDREEAFKAAEGHDFDSPAPPFHPSWPDDTGALSVGIVTFRDGRPVDWLEVKSADGTAVDAGEVLDAGESGEL